jgi:SAM-dependent methyltransferase
MPDVEDVRSSYDAVAQRYAEEIGDELLGKPIDRALYGCLAELVSPDGLVADVGCGPGHVTRYLADLGLTVLGVDASPGMVEMARRRYPALRFVVGTFAVLPAGDGEWSGAVAAYALIHLDRDGRRAAAVELARAIAAGGWLLAAFHVSAAGQPTGSVEHVSTWWDIDVALDFHFLDPVEVATDLETAGFHVMSRLDREPWPEVEYQSRRLYLLARRR